MDKERYRIGNTKIFFRSGVLGYMEELRDDIVQKLICYIQGACRGHLRRKDYATRKLQRYVGITIINYSHMVILSCLAKKNQSLNSRKKRSVYS